MTNERRYDEQEVSAIFEQATEVQQVAQSQPVPSEGMTLAELQVSEGRDSEAVHALDRLQGLGIAGERMDVLRARALYGVGRHGEADALLSPLASSKPDDLRLQNLHGLNCLRLGGQDDLGRAVGAFQRVVSLDGHHAAYRNNLGFALEKLGRLEEAYLAYVEAEGLSGSDSRYSKNRARVERALSRR